jgi:hypothetical protein
MRSRIPLVLLTLFALLMISQAGCKKDQLLGSGGELRFSTDTLSFDTVFTAQGSFTLPVKIANPQNRPVRISSVRLERGEQSFFNLNINGVAGNELRDIELAANDSIYVFATVNIDPGSVNTPFLVQDRLIATLNGRDFFLPLEAYGQNAHYITDSFITQDQVWTNDKPWVVIRGAAIDEGVTLTIQPGTRVYMHADSRLFVLGRLLAEGTATDSIIFQGDRLDRAYFGYRDFPGEWGGLVIFPQSEGSVLDYVTFKNGGNTAFGYTAAMINVFQDRGTNPAIPQLTMRHSTIANSLGHGLLCFASHVVMENSLIHSTGGQALGLFQGGQYNLVNCSFLNIQPREISHTENPTVAILNFYSTGQHTQIDSPLNAVLRNCLIYGDLNDELLLARDPSVPYNLSLEHCLIKTSAQLPTFVNAANCKFNEDPRLESPQKWNFRPATAASPLVDAGAMPAPADDRDGKPRNGIPDIGAYEF